MSEIKFIEFTEKGDGLTACILLSKIEGFGCNGQGGSFLIITGGDTIICKESYRILKTKIFSATGNNPI